MVTFDDLNGNQRVAAAWGEGPLLVRAGPGAGKTLVLALRVARLIRETPGKRFRVLGLAVTTKAADEMRQQVLRRLEWDSERARIMTFHANAIRILKQHGDPMGFRSDLAVLADDRDRLALLRKAVERVGAGGPVGWSETGLLRKLDCWMGSGDDVTEIAAPDREAWIRPVYGAYLDLLMERNCLDFPASLILCRRLFRERPIFARDQKVIYSYACVDEYQDTNRAQERFLRDIYPDRDANLFVVVDDDQTVHEWNGASPKRLRALRDYYGMRVLQLPRSFRCPSAVVGRANRLMGRDRERLFEKEPPESAAPTDAGKVLRALKFADEGEETRWIAEDIAGRPEPGRCAILARTHRLLDAAAKALEAAGVACHVTEVKREFESPLVVFVHAVLRLANAPTHREHFATVCRAYRDLTGVDLGPEEVEAESALTGRPLLVGFAEVAASRAVNGQPSLIAAVREHVLEVLDYRKFVAAAFEWTGGGEDRPLAGRDETNQGWEIRAWRDLGRQIRGSVGDRPSLRRFLEEMDGRPKSRPAGENEVRCLTIHGAKGLEFEHVYVAGLAQGELPSYRAVRRGGEAIREERRACFVAITRAAGSLTLTHADSYFGWRREPSQFLAEMEVETVNGSTPLVESRDGLSEALPEHRVAEGA